MQVLLQKLELLENRIRAIKEELDTLKHENKSLRDENLVHSKTIDRQKMELVELEHKLSEGTKAGSENAGTEALREKLEHYIAEVDECIKMVNSIADE